MANPALISSNLSARQTLGAFAVSVTPASAQAQWFPGLATSQFLDQLQLGRCFGQLRLHSGIINLAGFGAS